MAYVNPSFAKTFGYSPEEIIGNLTPKDLVHPGDIQAVMRRLSERLDGRAEEGRVLHHKAIKKDGSPIIIEVSGAVFDYQGRPAVMGTLIDVTEQKQAQEALRRSEEKYRQLVESSSDGIFTIDLNAKINWANDYAYKLLGYSESDLPIALRKLIPIKYWPAAMKLFYGGLKGKIVTEPFDLEILTKSGERIPVSYKGTLLHDENGNVISILGVIREMRGSKKLNALPLGTEEDGRKSN